MDGAGSYHRFKTENDKEALGELVALYNKPLVFYLTGITKNISAAEDAAADAFVEILVKKPKLRDENAFRAYLYRAGRNKAIDALRRQKFFSDAPENTDIEDEAADLEEALLKDERAKRLHQSLKELPRDYRDVLHLIYFEEMSYADAAGAMKKSVKQITNLVYRAKAALKEELRDL